MSGLNKKAPAMVRDRFARCVFDKYSKAALVDLVADMLRGDAGDETLDGENLVRALVERMGPVSYARRDKPLDFRKLQAWWNGMMLEARKAGGK